jgi:hypothetical protein
MHRGVVIDARVHEVTDCGGGGEDLIAAEVVALRLLVARGQG